MDVGQIFDEFQALRARLNAVASFRSLYEEASEAVQFFAVNAVSGKEFRFTNAQAALIVSVMDTFALGEYKAVAADIAALQDSLTEVVATLGG